MVSVSGLCPRQPDSQPPHPYRNHSSSLTWPISSPSGSSREGLSGIVVSGVGRPRLWLPMCSGRLHTDITPHPPVPGTDTNRCLLFCHTELKPHFRYISWINMCTQINKGWKLILYKVSHCLWHVVKPTNWNNYPIMFIRTQCRLITW